MKKSLLILSLAGFVLASCGGGKLSVSAYNEKAVTAFNYLSTRFSDDTEKIFDHELSTEQSKTLLADLGNALDSCANLTAALAYPDDAKALHESILKVYSFEKDSLLPLLGETLNFEPESDEWYNLWNEIDTRIERCDVLLDVMSTHQEELAAKVGAELR